MLLLCALLAVAQSESAPIWPAALVRADEALARGDSASALAELDKVEAQRPGLATTLYYRARALADERPELALDALEQLRGRGGYDPAIARWDPLLAELRKDERFERALGEWESVDATRGAWQSAPHTRNGTVRAIDPYDEGGPPQHVVWSDGRTAIRIDLSTGRVVGRVAASHLEPPGDRPEGGRIAGSEATFVFDAEGVRALSLEPGGVIGVHELRGAEPARRVSEFDASSGPEWQAIWATNAAAWRGPFATFAASPEPSIVVLDREGYVTVRDLEGRLRFEPALRPALGPGQRSRLVFTFSPRIRTRSGWGIGAHDIERGGLLWLVEDGEASLREVPGRPLQELYHGCGMPVVSPDLRHLAWADRDFVHVIDLQTSAEVWKEHALPDMMREHLAANELAWSPDGAYLAVSTQDMFGTAIWSATGTRVVSAPLFAGNGFGGLEMRWESLRRVRVGGTTYDLETQEIAPDAVAVVSEWDDLGHYALRADVRVTSMQVGVRTPIARDRGRRGLHVADAKEDDVLILIPIPNVEGPGLALIAPSGHIAPHGDPFDLRLIRPSVERRPTLTELPELAARAIDPLAVRASRAGVRVEPVLEE